MRRKTMAIIMAMLIAFSIGTFGAVAPGGISIGGTNVMGDGAGFVGYVSLSGDIVTITATLRGPIYGLSCAKFGVKYNKDKVEVIAVEEQPFIPSPSPISPTPTPPVIYQNSGFMTVSAIDGYASYTNLPAGMTRSLKYLNAQMMNTWCYASVGMEKISERYENIDYSPSAGLAFTAAMKFRIKAGSLADISSIKSYFTLSGDVSAPTLMEAGGKKLIAVAANFADAYVVPAIAHLDYTAIVAGDATPAPDASIANPTRKASPASSATFIAKDTMESGTPAGAISLPGDGPNALKVYGTDNRFLYLNHIYTTAAPRISYPFASPASGPFTIEFDYLPVAEATGSIALTISGKDNNGTSSEKWYVNMSISKSVIMNMTGNMAGNSGTVFSSANLDSDMLAGSPVARYRVCVYVKPEEQAYDIYVDDIKVSTASYEYRHKGVLASTASPDYPPVGEVKFTSLAISTSSAAATYKAGFDNIMAYGGAPELNIYEATKYYVSPEGNDSNPGTIDKPFLSMERAHRVVRAFNSNMTQDIIVYVSQGDYYVDATMQFGIADSGTNGHKIIYKNKDAIGSARIIGGKKLSGWEQMPGSNVYRVNVGTGKGVETLYENEKIARVARTPNYKQESAYPSQLGEYFISQSGDAEGTYLQYYPNQINPAGWTITGNAKIVWWGQKGYQDWGLGYKTIGSIDSDMSNRKIYFSTPYAYGAGQGDRYYIEGIYELLDAPGELFYDAADGMLYYWPMDGNPNSSEIILPEVNDIIKVAGDAVGVQAHDISFEGLYFYGTKKVNSSSSGAGIVLTHTNHINITNCHFKNLGGFGVKIADDNEYNKVTGCWVEHCGAGGIWISNGLNRTLYPDNKSQYHEVSNCKIHDLTELNCEATFNGGVVLWDTKDCVVKNCEIYNAARYAISLRGHYSTQNNPTPDNLKHYAVGNRYEYIKIYNCGTDSGDMGALHAAHCNKTDELNINYWNQITIDSIHANPSTQDIKPNGIFLDHPNSCENQSLSNINITNTQGNPYRTNKNPKQTLVNVSWNAGFVDANMEYAKIGLTSSFPSAYGTSTTPAITPEPTSLPGEIVVDNSSVGYTETGAGWVPSSIGNTINGGARYNISKSATQSAKWTPAIVNSGLYDVYVWKFGTDAAANPAAKYTINSAGGQVVYYINQRANSGCWEKIGSYYFLSGTSGNVTLTCDVPNYVPTGAVRADAVKFVPVLPADAQGYWALNEGSGAVATDGTTNALTGTLIGSPVYQQSSRQGAGLIFDGIDDAVQVADNDKIEMGTGDFSISMWFKREANTTPNLRLISKGAESETDIGYALEGSDTSITAMVSDGTKRRAAVGAHSGTGKWNHVVAQYDRDGMLSLYVNGKCEDAIYIGDLSQGGIINSKNLMIGRGGSAGASCWGGEIDEVRVYQRKLTFREITSLYTLGSAKDVDVFIGQNISLYQSNQELSAIPQSEGQVKVKTTYTNGSSKSKLATLFVVVKKDNRLLSVKAVEKTFGADETYTFDHTIDIPAYSSAPSLSIQCMLWDGAEALMPITTPLMLSR